MASPTSAFHPIRLSDLAGRVTEFDLRPDAEALAALASDLDLLDLRKVRFAGTIGPEGASDWRLDATLGATVVQPCRVTLEPVTTRIDEPVLRRYVAHMPPPKPGEVEMPEDDTIEPKPETVTLGDVLAEALALALPAYPRSDAAIPHHQVFTEPGKKAMQDEDARPFAGLAALRNNLKKDPE